MNEDKRSELLEVSYNGCTLFMQNFAETEYSIQTVKAAKT